MYLKKLFQLVRENLTESNLPTCQCAVCLYGFSEGDSFIKTECYHYFHSYCLALHLTTTERLFKDEQEKLPMWQRQKTGFQVSSFQFSKCLNENFGHFRLNVLFAASRSTVMFRN